MTKIEAVVFQIVSKTLALGKRVTVRTNEMEGSYFLSSYFDSSSTDLFPKEISTFFWGVDEPCPAALEEIYEENFSDKPFNEMNFGFDSGDFEEKFPGFEFRFSFGIEQQVEGFDYFFGLEISQK